jgi:hypothetical protein
MQRGAREQRTMAAFFVIATPHGFDYAGMDDLTTLVNLICIFQTKPNLYC